MSIVEHSAPINTYGSVYLMAIVLCVPLFVKQEGRAMINEGFDMVAYNEMVVTINGAFAKIF